MHDISVAAVAALLTLSCQSNQSETSGSETTRDTPAPAKPRSGELVIDKTPAPSLALDCAALLTAADLHKMCGIEGTFAADPFETGKGATSCSRRAGPNGQLVRFAVGVYPHAESARSVTRGVPPGEVKVESKRAGGATSIAAHMRKGNIAVTVTATHIAQKEPPCSAEQLGKLAMVIDSRLP